MAWRVHGGWWIHSPGGRTRQSDCQTPKGVTGEREIKLLRLVVMVGIFGVGTEQQNAAGDPLAHEGAPLAEPFTIAVVFEEALAEIGWP